MYTGPMRQADGQQRADGLQTSFVDVVVQADVDSNPRRRRRPHEGAAAHASMLEMNNYYVRSFDLTSSCSQVCYRSLSRSLELLADSQRSSEHRG